MRAQKGAYSTIKRHWYITTMIIRSMEIDMTKTEGRFSLQRFTI